MTKKTYITTLKEIEKITLIRKKCSSELHFPMNKIAPENCPFCKRRIGEHQLKQLANLQESLTKLKKDEEFEIQFQTDYTE